MFRVAQRAVAGAALRRHGQRGVYRQRYVSHGRRWVHGVAAVRGSGGGGGDSEFEGVRRLVAEYAGIPQERRRCFGIVAHIDHGKSTLADQLLMLSGNIAATDKQTQQVLDSLDVERERGITVKAQTASMIWTDAKGDKYLLSLIDTPGHVDFSFEVSRSMAACQGALLLVDCSQGVQAQTVANYHAAKDAGLQIVPVLTKIDLPTADPEPVLTQMEQVFGLDPDGALWTSAKTGDGIEDVFSAIVERLPPPSGDVDGPFRCLLFDSWYDTYRGVVCVVQVVDGSIRKGMTVAGAHSGKKFQVQEVGLLAPARYEVDELSAGQIGYLITGMKSVKEAQVGDTLCDANAEVAPLPGFEPAKPMVFASIFPVDSGDFEELQASVDKLLLQDPSVTVERESSDSLGFGLRCGFLGLLHMDVFHTRLQDDFNTPVIATAPMVPYTLTLKDGTVVEAERPADFPLPHEVESYSEPMVSASIIIPQDRISPVLSLMQDRRGEQTDMVYLDDGRILLKYDVPWAEVVTDFFDVLKSVSAGYASFDYEPIGVQKADIVKVDILVNGKPLDALCFVVHRKKADTAGRAVLKKLRATIKRQQFEVILQAVIGNKIFAKERIPPYRKDVLTKAGKTVGGGDVSRKRKLLEKQKKGKARMKTVGSVELSQDSFHSVLSR